MVRARLSEEEIQTMLTMFAAGKNVREIAEVLHCSTSTVHARMRRLGISNKREKIPQYDPPEQIRDCLHCNASRDFCDNHCSGGTCAALRRRKRK